MSSLCDISGQFQVSTVVEPGRFDDVLSSLLHGNIAAGLR